MISSADRLVNKEQEQLRTGFINRLVFRIKRAETPFWRGLKRLIVAVMKPGSPRIPPRSRVIFRALYELHFAVIVIVRRLVTFFYRGPVFQGRCHSYGRNVTLAGSMPFVTGHVDIEIGDGVYIGGNVSILSGGPVERPRLVVGNRSSLGWNNLLVVNREIIIEDDVFIPHDCRISDSDGHPREADLRVAGVGPDLKDIRPVRICSRAWIGNGSHIMKGVTIGEGAIIGANSVVISNVPAYALAMGNPAEVILRQFGLPANMKKGTRPPTHSLPPG
jgi:acetyltransferase-like isoleucine patch superfamily enzyme